MAWPCLHSSKARFKCGLGYAEQLYTGESPEWPACCEVHLAPFVLSVFDKNQTGESPE